MNIFKSITHHIKDTSIFVLAVSLAAVAHSSWTFSTILGGVEPPDVGERIPWMLTGLFLAFSLDIGLLALSSEIRHGRRSFGRFVAFVVLAAAMAYLQTVFCLTHAPLLTLSKAVRPEWINGAQLILDLAVFLTPALLPVAIVLHTFSGEKAEQFVQPSTAEDLRLNPQIVETRTPKQRAIDEAVENGDLDLAASLADKSYVIGFEDHDPESAGVAIAAVPLDRSNGHRLE